MSWRTARWCLVFFAAACNRTTADPEPSDTPLTTTPGSTPFPCEVGAALQRNCWQCHGSKLDHAAPMRLTTWESVHERTKDGTEEIFQRIGRRVHDNRDPMPPSAICAPGGDCKPTAAEMAALDAWISKGAPAGNGCTPVGQGGAGNVPNTGGAGGVPNYGTGGVVSGGAGSIGTGGTGGIKVSFPDGGQDDVPVPPDPTECDMLNFHARQDASGAPFNVPSGEQYYCFGFHLSLEQGAQALGFYTDIVNSQVIHHWLLYKMGTPQTDGQVNACLGTHPDGELIAGWALGGGDWFLPKHVGMELGTGDFILEAHYNNSGPATTDASGVHVCKAKVHRPETASLSWLGVDIFPVPGLNIPAGATPATYKAESNCTPTITTPIHILRSWPHMHKTGAHMTSTVHRQGGGTETLIDRDFSFNDQRQYDTPKILNTGDFITTDCFYDNQTGAAINFGESTSQEMCYNFIVAYPARALISAGDPIHSTACINY